MEYKNMITKRKFFENMLAYLSHVLLFMILIFLSIINLAVSAQHISRPIQPFGTITVIPDFELNGPGKNVDSIDFWETPETSNTLMFVTAKDNSLLEVWKYPFKGNSRLPLRHPTFANSNVNGVVVDQETNRVYISVAEPSSTVSVFSLPELDFQMNFNKWWADYQGEPNIALLKLPNGAKRVYVSADDVVYIHDATTGKYLDKFKPVKGLETIAADHFYQRLYIPDENDRSGVFLPAALHSR
jgi:DNA-binding beta-propeller fold protein YncE